MSFTKDREIRERGLSRAELGVNHILDDQLEVLNNEFKDELLENLGIVIGDDDSVPFSGTTPRMFMITTDENGNEKFSTIDNSGFKLGSPEFWRQVQLGNVFAYPSDQKDPVQLQLDVGTSGKAELHCSKPVNASNLPESPAKPLTFFQSVANFFTRRFRRQAGAFRNKDANASALKSRLNDMQSDRIKLQKDSEKKAAENALKELEAKKVQERKESSMNSAKLSAEQMDFGEKGMTSVFRPDPEFHTEYPFLKIHKGKGNKDSTWGLYTEEQFKSLNVYGKKDIDLDTISVGISGNTVKPDEFAAVTMYALWDDEIAGKANTLTGNYDIHGVKSLQQIGIPAAEAKSLIAAPIRSMYTTDLFINNFRDSEGKFFKEVTNLGRKKAVDAFKAYGDGDRTPLAKIIADGINKAAKAFNYIDGTSISAQDLGTMVMSEKVTSLLDRDPTLYDEAVKHGMSEENLNAVKALHQLKKLEQAERNAVYEITKANAEGRELSVQEKTKYAQDILRSKFAKMQIATENAENQVNERGMEIYATLGDKMQNVNQLQEKQWAKNPELRPAPKPGMVWGDTASHVMFIVGNEYKPLPKSGVNLTAEESINNLNKLAENATKNLDVANQSMDWMYRELAKGDEHNKPTLDMTKVLSEADKIQVPKNEAPAPAPVAAEKKNSIKQRAAFFEPKNNQNQGPSIG